jgi:hypothetical protein
MNIATRRLGFTVALIFAVILTLAGPAREAAAADSYLLVKGGVYSPNANEVDQLNEGVAAEIAIGRYIWPMIGLELGVGYFEASQGGVDLTVYPATLAAKFRLPIPVIKPYAIAGVGAYFSKLETPGGGSADDTAFGYFGGVGVDFKLAFLLINLEAKYLVAKPDFGVETNIDGYVGTVGVGLEF